MANAPAYLQGDTDLHIRDTILAFMPPVINLDSPASSRVVVKGGHEGPALSAQDISSVVEWITAEKAAAPAGTPIETAQMTPMICTAGNPGDATCPINHVDLSSVGAAGATIDFAVMNVSGMYMFVLKVVAGTDGVYMVHPLFESWPSGATMPTADPIDRYYNVLLNVMSGGNAPLGDGTASLGFNIGDPISIRFTALDKYHP